MRNISMDELLLLLVLGELVVSIERLLRKGLEEERDGKGYYCIAKFS